MTASQGADRRSGLLVPALSTAAMVAVLLGLGVWQVERMAWKRGLLAAFAAGEQAPPAPLGAAPPPPFAIVAATGHLRADLLATYGAEVRGNVLGAQVLVPLERADGPPVLADLGWMALPAHPALPSGEVSVVGYARPGEHPGWFSAADDPAGRQFYTLDPAAIGAALGLPGPAPFVVVALGGPPPPGAPDPARHLPELPNNHLQYAITWFSLAGVAVAVFAVYARRRPRT